MNFKIAIFILSIITIRYVYAGRRSVSLNRKLQVEYKLMNTGPGGPNWENFRLFSDFLPRPDF
jgi:hypothetical protein